MKKLSFILILVLSACGGGGGAYDSAGAGGSSGATPPASAPPTISDAFVTAVLALVGVSSDSADPAAVDAIASTTPENSEPAPVE